MNAITLRQACSGRLPEDLRGSSRASRDGGVGGLARTSLADLRGDLLIAVGDLVATGENFHPNYRVIAVTEDRAWIRDSQFGTDHIVPADRCRKINDGAA